LQTMEFFDPTNTKVWSSTAPLLPTARWGLAAATSNDGRIFVVGGSSGIVSSCINNSTSPCVATNVFEIYDPVGKTWACSIGDLGSNCQSLLLQPLPTARYFLGAAVGRD